MPLSHIIPPSPARSQHMRSTHDKVMRRRPDKQGRSGLQGFQKAGLMFTFKTISVFLMLAILDYSLISVTQIEDLP